ncbi:MAG: hypothetical protein ABIQ31_18620, partial [Ferruginibacter sp.]
MIPLEKKELRGISLATVITIIIATGSIILSVENVYYNLKSELKEMQMSKDGDTKLNDLKLRQ